MNATLALTDEQLDALDGFRSGETLKVVAGAGAGKTSTLLAMADSMPDGATGRYLAFNRSIVDEAKRKMPDHIVASTVHSLAYAGIDERFKDRVTRDRMPSFELARRYRVMPMTFRVDGHANGEIHALTNNQVASLAYRGVTRFCESADLAPAACHVPHVPALDWVDDRGRRHSENNDAIAAALVPLMTRMWADISNPHGPVPISLDHVVKLYELSDFDLGVDVLMMDECQPPGTMVSVATTYSRPEKARRYLKPIEDLEVGDWVISYQKGSGLAKKRGSRVLGKSTRHFDGELIRITTPSGLTSRYTPNHICMAAFGSAFDGNHLLYLMRKGDRWRVGVAKDRHGRRYEGGVFGPAGRLLEEKADAVWILAAYPSRLEAEAAEEAVSLRWRLPQACFSKDLFWAQWDADDSDPDGCMSHFGRELEYPMIETKAKKMMHRRFTEIRACNLMPGMEVMNSAGEMEPIEIVREPYSGPVVSLTISGPKTYVADGIVTHNCQDVNAVFASLCMKQMAKGTQLVAVGDPQQCQPTGTLVTIAQPYVRGNWRDGGIPSSFRQVPIEQIKAGDRVVSYDMTGSYLRRSGSAVTAVASRPYDGELIEVTAVGHTSRYTPNHKCLARVDEVFDGKFIVYLMRRGDDYRVGKTTGSYKSQNKAFGLSLRMTTERADAGWVLSTHDTEAEALEAEQLASWSSGVPTLTFKGGTVEAQQRLDRFWGKLGSNAAVAKRLLAEHGRMIEYPLVTAGDGMFRRKARIVQACNLMDGMRVLPFDGALETNGKRCAKNRWETITVARRWFTGEVHSLQVERDETYVADGIVTHNSIYGWRGAVDAFNLLPAATRTATLSLSFRFGPAIANVANIPLDELGSSLRIRGNPAKDSVVGPVKVPDAFLCRTNATAVEKYLEVTRRGFRTHLMGGASEMLSFARAAEKLQAGRTVEHPDLGGFNDWAEVGAYVRNDPSGRDLATSYELVEQFGAAKLVKALTGMSKTPRSGEIIVSTAHKAKGREWPTVRLADDFAFHHPDRPVISDEELRLLYVAATRAQDVLAVDRTRYFNPRHQGAGSCR